MARRRRATFVLVAAVLAAVGSGLASAQDDPASVCPGATTQDGVIVCPRLFAGPHPLRLPADPSSTQRYGAFVRGGDRFYTRSGKLPLSPALADQLRGSRSRPDYARQVFLATISDGQVTAIAEKVRVAENAVLDAVFGGRVMEGTIGTADGRNGFNVSGKTLPVRIELVARAAHGALSGRIVNARHAVRSSGGRCLPALSANRRRDPLRDGFSARIALARQPSMHAAFDDEMLAVWNQSASNMGRAFYPSIATLLGGDPLGKRWVAFIHGAPTSGPALRLRLVAARGGKRC
jgi:hypothetical protein